MSANPKNEHLRIIIGACLIAFSILTFAFLNGYGTEIRKEITHSVLKLVPELDQGLAQL
ncbi:hypothetical protein [Flavobacterium sp. ASW18X]|uniref:hypothetical protein n=1 Tax=Flavobacterium sp. ASW18X TaxID=2572595 RepID=UPI00146EB3F8|nr:hypothetical protein [Flavobacterium sp. ASW18X]